MILLSKVHSTVESTGLNVTRAAYETSSPFKIPWTPRNHSRTVPFLFLWLFVFYLFFPDALFPFLFGDFLAIIQKSNLDLYKFSVDLYYHRDISK